jgi:hypothetical protein
MNWIGIDIGLKGGIVAVDEDKNITIAVPMPTCRIGKKTNLDIVALAHMMESWPRREISMICIEQPGSHMPSAAATASCNYQFGVCVGLLYRIACANTILRAQTWQKEYAIAGTKGNTKTQAKAIASALYPDAGRTILGHEGMVDALLIAEYARRKNL